MLSSPPQAVICDAVPGLPSCELLQRNTIAALVMLPSQAKKPMAFSQGPMESDLHGIGLLQLIAIFNPSERSSTQLFTRKQQAASGQATEKSDKYPDFHGKHNLLGSKVEFSAALTKLHNHLTVVIGDIINFQSAFVANSL